MSTKLPCDVSGREVVKALEKIGYRVVHQKGSHVRMRDDTNPNHLPVTVPDHKKDKAGFTETNSAQRQSDG